MNRLTAQTTDLPLTGGLAEAVDRKLVSAGSFLRLVNVEHVKQGSLAKRQGYGYLATTGRAVRTVGTRSEELFGLSDGASLIEAPSLLAYHQDENSWTRQCDAWQVEGSRRPVVRSYEGALCAQRQVVGSRVVYVWVGGPAATGALFYRVEDIDGGVVRPDRLFSGNIVAPNCLFCVTQTSGKIVCVYFPGTGTKLRLWTLDPSTFAEVDVVTGVNHVQVVARRIFDAKAVPVAPGFVAVANPFCPSSASNQKISMATVNVASGLIQAQVIGTTTGRDFSAIQIRFTESGTTAGVAYRRRDLTVSRDDVYLAQFPGFTAAGNMGAAPSYDNVIFGAADNLDFSAQPTPSRTASYGVGLCQDTALDPAGWVVVTCHKWGTMARRIDDGGAVAGSTDYFVASAHLLAEPFSLGGRVMALLGEFVNHVDDPAAPAKNKPLSAALVCVWPGIESHGATGSLPTDVGTRYLVATALVESVSSDYTDMISMVGTADGGRGMSVPSVNADGSVSIPATVVLSVEGLDALRGVDELRVYNTSQTSSVVDMGRTSVSSGGLTSQYDGRNWTELGFLHRASVLPIAPVFSPVGIGFGVPGGNYVYAFVYEYQDDQGRIHQSEPAFLSLTVPTAGGFEHTVSFRIRCIGLTQKPAVGIVVYRSQNNGTLLYRISPRSNDATPQAIVNDPGVSDKTFVDDNTDAELIKLGRGVLYTNGGERANVSAPPSLYAVRHGNRLCLLSADEPGDIWFSKLLSKSEPANFGRGFQLRIDGLPGQPVALASLDDKLVVLTPSSLHYIVGPGPNNTGADGGFSEAFDIAVDGGCVDPRSVISTQMGVFFLARKGLVVLTRGLAVEFAGAAVEDTTRAYPVCRRATLDSEAQRVYWLMSTADGADNVYVVYDYDNNAWYVWPVSPTAQQVDQTVWRGKHAVNDGRPALRGFGAAPGSDPDGSYVTMAIETPELSFSSVGGFRRLRNVIVTGERLHPHTLRLRLYEGFSASTSIPDQSRTFDLSSSSTMNGLPNFQAILHVKHQKSSSARVLITDETAAGTTGAAERTGAVISGLTLEFGVIEGPSRLAPQNKR